MVKADTVSFGEPIPMDVLMRCQDHSARADLVIVAGTSATVYPAAGFALEVKQRGGVLVEVNLYESEITGYCNISLRGGSANVLPRLTKAISEKRRATLVVIAPAFPHPHLLQFVCRECAGRSLRIAERKVRAP